MCCCVSFLNFLWRLGSCVCCVSCSCICVGRVCVFVCIVCVTLAAYKSAQKTEPSTVLCFEFIFSWPTGTIKRENNEFFFLLSWTAGTQHEKRWVPHTVLLANQARNLLSSLEAGQRHPGHLRSTNEKRNEKKRKAGNSAALSTRCCSTQGQWGF